MNTEEKLNSDNEVQYIDCIGTDRKQHLCLPWANKSVCGITIIKKNLNPKERATFCSCYECTY